MSMMTRLKWFWMKVDFVMLYCIIHSDLFSLKKNPGSTMIRLLMRGEWAKIRSCSQ